MKLLAEQQGPLWQGEFPVAAGGVVSYTNTLWTGFKLFVGCTSLAPASAGSQVQLLVLHIQEDAALLGLADEQGQLQTLASISGHAIGLEPGQCTTYWLSLDARGTVKYGKGYHMEETTLLRCCLPGGKLGSNGSEAWWRTPQRKTVTLCGSPGAMAPTQCSLYDAQLEQRFCSQGGIVTFDRCPLMHNPPAVVADPASMSLLDLGWRSGLPACDLPPACRALYDQLSAPDIDLEHDCPLGLSLLAAIRHSLQTPGALLNTTLLAKAGSCRGGSSKRCYIRVAVAAARGNSPGEPFVLEIWPPGHGSPIHSHGNAFGVTRMLHGALALSIYNKGLHHEEKPLQHLVLEQGQLTWFSPNWYQTHQLDNCSSTDFCCSINGFQYGPEDNVHWPYMQFKGSSVGDVHDFEPVCDFDFAELRDALLEEYQHAPSFQGTNSMMCMSAPQSPATPSGQLMHSQRQPLQHSPTCSAASEALHMYLFDI